MMPILCQKHKLMACNLSFNICYQTDIQNITSHYSIDNQIFVRYQRNDNFVMSH